MALTPKKVWLINGAIFFLILFLFIKFPLQIVGGIGDFLNSINYPPHFVHMSNIDAIIISLIPIASYLIYSRKNIITAKTIIIANTLTTISVIFVITIAYIIVAYLSEPSSPLLPSYIVIIPYPKIFWKPIILVGELLPIFIIRLKVLLLKK